MEDEPVKQEPSLPFVDSEDEKKVDEDPETHSDDDSRDLQPSDGYSSMLYNTVVSYM